MESKQKAVIIQRLIEARPPNAPEGWLIFNAPRPLFGTLAWEEPFRHGIFFVAINPADARAVEMIRVTTELDGWLCQYVSMAEVKAWAQATAEARSYGEAVSALDDERLCEWYRSEQWRAKGNISLTDFAITITEELNERR